MRTMDIVLLVLFSAVFQSMSLYASPLPGNTTLEVPGNVAVEVRGSSTVEVPDRSSERVRGSSTVRVIDNSAVKVPVSSTVEVPVSSTEEVPDNSSERVRGSSTVRVIDNLATTEVPVSSTIEVPVSSTVEVPVSSTVEVPVSSTEEVPVSSTVEVPVSSTVEVPVSSTEEVPVSSTVEVPVSSTVKVPVSSTVKVPVSSTVKVPDNSSERVRGSSTVRVIDNSAVEVPGNSTVKVPVSSTVEVPVSSTVEVPVSSTVEVPGNSTVEVPVSSTVEVPGNSTVKVPVNSSVELPDKKAYHYCVFLDLGKTGTKVNVYRWVKSPSSPLPYIEKRSGEKFKPGIAEYVDKTDDLEMYMPPIMQLAGKMVPKNQWADTPIFAMATSGMRSLLAVKSMALLDALREYLSDPLMTPFKYERKDVQVLSGEEEGVYSWVALNYLLGFFDSHMDSSESTGVMEMGGGSTQITFIPQEPLYAGEFQVELLSKIYELYTHSYLGYGLDMIEEKLAAYLNDHKESVNPCLLEGDVKTYKEDSLIVVGSSSPTECRKLLKKLIKTTDCLPGPCAIGNVYQPHVRNTPFYATGAFKYLTYNLDVLDEYGNLDFEQLKWNGDDYCRQDLREALEFGATSQYASSTCLQAQYYQVLFRDAYHIPDFTPITITSDLNGEGIDWALGAVLVELSRHAGVHASVRRR